MGIENFDFKVGLLQKFWNKRDKELVPANRKGFGLQKQKFLVFYNLIARTTGDQYDLSNLKAFKDGPLYYDVYSCVKNYNIKLEQKPLDKKYEYNPKILNAVTTLLEAESASSVSEITHVFEFWQKKYSADYDEKIKNEELYNCNDIYEEDITNQDDEIIEIIFEYYSDIYDNYIIKDIHGKRCALEKENLDKIDNFIERDWEYYKDVFENLKETDTMAKIYINEIGGISIDI